MRKMQRFAATLVLFIGLGAALAGAATQAGGSEAGKPLSVDDPETIARTWGIRIESLRLSASGYMLDFRYRVVDERKAKPLFERKIKPKLRDDASGIEVQVPVPPKTGALRNSNQPHAGRSYFMFFGNPARFIKAGSRVTITIGGFSVEGVRVEPDPDAARSTTERAMAPQPAIGDIALVDDRGRPTTLRAAIGTDKAVFVNFIFTSCRTICPVMSAGFSTFHAQLGADADRVRLVSVTIDPETDTPPVLRAYAERLRAPRAWTFLTGTPEATEAAQRAFEAYRGDRNNHAPTTYFRRSAGSPWERIEGLPSAQTLRRVFSGESNMEEQPAAGERFYREGRSITGTEVRAIVQGDLEVDSARMPCENCHRRSGWGTSEGPVTVPAIVGDVLFNAITRGAKEFGPVRASGPGTRPAYTEASLLKALREGIDPAGRRLSATMPRYAIGDTDGAALITYMRSLSSKPPDGVTRDAVHLATIVTPDADPAARASMLEVLRTYVRHKNAGTRHETRRRESGPWDMKQHYANYRTWILHEWELQGDSAGWAAQLEALYRDEPVFAIVGGASGGDWTPIHEFSERFKVPVVLPQTPVPPDPKDGGNGFYSLYYSRGVRLEADTLAHHLSSQALARVLQISRCGSAGTIAAARFAERAVSPGRVRTECIPGTEHVADGLDARLAEGTDALVLWLGPDDVQALASTTPGRWLDGAPEVYLSSTLLGSHASRVPTTVAARASLLHPMVSPEQFGAHAIRAAAWLKANQLTAPDPLAATNALFAAMLTSDALGHPRTLDSREYFVERIEHMAGRTPHRSTFPALSFDPGRRFGSTGCFVLKVPAVPGERFKEVQPWFVPSPRLLSF
jgi:cytochrome oxidase Cu insertion factor (SCO1/SenC/PrrC family)